MSNPNNLLLYIGDGCPFCAKVTNFMAEHQINIAVKDVWTNDDALDELIQLTGKRQVPCLRIDGFGLLESDDIIAYLKSSILYSNS